MAGFYYAFLLSKEECKDGNKKGYGYALKNKDRWIDISNVVKDGLWDSPNIGNMHIVKDNKVYNIYKNYVLFDESKCLFICQEFGLASDNVDNFIEKVVEEDPNDQE